MEKFVVWHDNYSVGHPLIDEQHLKLFELVNKMWKIRKESKEKRMHLFKQIEKLFHLHCRDEERILAKNGCKDIESHRHEHRKLQKQISKILDSCLEKDGGNKTWMEIMIFLMQDLLLNHLIGDDKKHQQWMSP
ncbi:MAG: hypothetical protein PHG47_04985 [Sulfuricella sp.]|nr:hypothetical protein [Sulfuricella sp.]